MELSNEIPRNKFSNNLQDKLSEKFKVETGCEFVDVHGRALKCLDILVVSVEGAWETSDNGCFCWRKLDL